MNGIAIGLDPNVFCVGRDAQRRQTKYAALLDSYDCIVISEKIPQKNSIDGIQFHSTASLNKVVGLIKSFFIALKIIKKHPQPVVIVQDSFITGAVGALLKAVTGCRLIVGVYGTNTYDPYRRKEKMLHMIFYFVSRGVYRYADAIQADGYETVTHLQQYYGDKVFRKPMIPSNISLFENAKQKGDTLTPVRLLFVGRLVRQKNIKGLLEVMNKLSESYSSKQIRLVMIGRGPYKDTLLSLIAKFDLEDYIEYHEFVPHDDIVGFFARSDALFLRSRYEGFPRVFMEAAAVGLPIITSTVSGVSHVIRQGDTGYHFPAEDTEAFVECIAMLILDPSQYRSMSKNIKKLRNENFSDDLTYIQQQKIFDYVAKSYYVKKTSHCYSSSRCPR